MDDKKPHICVCICTYQRPEMLRRLLQELERQDTGGLFTYSIVVSDNDGLRSAEMVVSEFAASSPVPVRYYVEARQNIALARNKAVENACGDFIAFIDDDELPIRRWLLTLFQACRESGSDGALGTVKPQFEEQPPRWLVKGKFHERETYPTGLVIDWRKGRTGNLLFRRAILTESAFRPEFLSGEDQDFFRRMIDNGHTFIWCNEAVAFEVIPPARWRRSFLLRRALFRGTSNALHTDCGPGSVVKSIVAVPGYSAVLPLALLAGQHRFMSSLVKLSYHLGKILGVLGIQVIKAYVSN